MTSLSYSALDEALTLNHAQDRLVHDPSPDVDSLAEVMRELYRCHDLAAVKHLVQMGIHMLADLRHHNHAERGHIEHAQAPAESLPPRERRAWTVKTLAAAVRDPLGDLLNPVLADVHEERREHVRQVVRDVLAAGCGDLLAGSLEKELRGAKFGALSRIVREVRS